MAFVRAKYKFCSDTSEIPKVPHWAAFQGTSVHIPGDERSRTHPGHGYPESSHSYLYYIAFESEADMNLWVNEESKSQYGKPFVVAFIKPATITKSVSVSVA